jgi:hypothetical protein
MYKIHYYNGNNRCNRDADNTESICKPTNSCNCANHCSVVFVYVPEMLNIIVSACQSV